MVRALLAGDRRATPVQVLAMLGLLCLLASSLGLTLAYRAQLQDFKSTIYERCVQRAAYDEANNLSVRADAELYQQILDISDQAPEQTDPITRALVARQREVIRVAQQRKAKAAEAGVVGSCERFK